MNPHLAVCALALALVACGSRALPETSDGATCGGLTILPPVGFDCAQGFYPVGLDISQGRIFHTALKTPGGSDLDLFARDVASGQVEQLTSDETRTEILATDNGEVLYSAHGKDPAAGQLYRQTPSHLVDLGLRSDPGTDGVFSQYTARPARLMSQGAVVWRAARAIYRHDGVSTHAIAGVTNLHYLDFDHRGGSVVWTDVQDIYLYRGGAVTALTHDDVDDRRPRLCGSSVYWICGDAICRWDGAATQQMDSGTCTDLTTDDARAAWICGNQVMLHDGKTTRGIAGNRGDDTTARDGLRLDGGRVAWLETKQSSPGGMDERGKIYLSDGSSTVLVAEVGLPCMVCNALWPPLQLALAGDVIAWSYHLDGDPPTYDYRGGRCAHATIRDEECR